MKSRGVCAGTAPGTTEQVWPEPEIFRLPPPRGRPDSRNCYVVADGGEYLVIDPSLRTPEGAKALGDGLAALGCGEGAPLTLFFTHLHSGWAGIRPEYLPAGAQVCLGRADCRGSDPARQWTYQRRWYRREGFPKGELKQYAGEDGAGCGPTGEAVRSAALGKTLSVGSWTFRCLPLPGHTPSHTALYLPEQRLFFSGDLVLYCGIPYVGVWKGEPRALEDYLDSLEKLIEYAPAALFPAHGSWEGDPAGRAEALGRHYYLRLLELYQLVRDHPGLTAYGLAGRFRWKGRDWAGLSPKQKWFAMGETLSHLTYLRDRGYVETRLSGEGLVNLPGKRRLTDF